MKKNIIRITGIFMLINSMIPVPVFADAGLSSADTISPSDAVCTGTVCTDIACTGTVCTGTISDISRGTSYTEASFTGDLTDLSSCMSDAEASFTRDLTDLSSGTSDTEASLGVSDHIVSVSDPMESDITEDMASAATMEELHYVDFSDASTLRDTSYNWYTAEQECQTEAPLSEEAADTTETHAGHADDTSRDVAADVDLMGDEEAQTDDTSEELSDVNADSEGEFDKGATADADKEAQAGDTAEDISDAAADAENEAETGDMAEDIPDATADADKEAQADDTAENIMETTDDAEGSTDSEDKISEEDVLGDIQGHKSSEEPAAADTASTDTGTETATAEARPFSGNGSGILTIYDKGSVAFSPFQQISWRFRRTAGVLKTTREETSILSDMRDDAGAVGTIDAYGLVHVLSEEEDGWDYVESGDVRGFIRSDLLASLSELTSARHELAKQMAAEGRSRQEVRTALQSLGKAAECTTDPLDNAAFLYRRLTCHPVTVEKKYGLVVTQDDPLNVRSGPGTENTVIAQIPKGGLVYLLEDDGQGWMYVESGGIKGYVCSEYLDISDEITQQIVKAGESSYPQAELRTRSLSLLMPSLFHSFVSVWTDDAEEAVRADERISSELALSPSGTEAAFLAPFYDVHSDSASTTSAETASGAAKSSAADQITTSSVSAAAGGTASDERRQQIVALARSAIGCPYVWGGNDLYNGCDCSGFAQQIYTRIGISIPRTAEAQAYAGRRIPCEEAKPGDLIFYASNGCIHHTSVYAGTDASGTPRSIEAYGTNYGIIETNAFGRDECWACTWM